MEKYMDILGKAHNYDVHELEESLGQRNIADFVRSCEASFMKRLAEIAYDTAWNPNIKTIFISGPTSSGKTTFTSRLASALHLHGRPTCTISMDDYYKDNLSPRMIDGRPDLENLYTLDVELMLEQIELLNNGKKVQIPTFDFKTKKRIFEPHKNIRLTPRTILLIEGLHGLSQQISGELKDNSYVNVLIMPHANLFADRLLLTSREIRVLRRVCRDAQHRNSSSLETLDYWPMLDSSEKDIFPEYIPRAHIYVNSAMAYEFCVIPALAEKIIRQDLAKYEAGSLKIKSKISAAGGGLVNEEKALAFAQNLLAIIAKLPVISPSVVPENSILNEFIR